MEDSWLGAGKTFLLGKLKSESAQHTVNEVAGEVSQFLSLDSHSSTKDRLVVMLSGIHFLSQEQIFLELKHLAPEAEDEAVFEVSQRLLGYGKTKLNFVGEQREPVVLVLDPEIQALPWESLPTITKSKQAFSR